MSDEPTASFEELFQELAETVARLEVGGLSLTESVETYERGLVLARRCSGMLKEAELRVEKVTREVADANDAND
jgi:exodeoxyribonuclease VII small subunit